MSKDKGMHREIPFCVREQQSNPLQILRRCKGISPKSDSRRVFLYAFPKGSLTLETALVLPLLLCAVTAMLYLFVFTAKQAEDYRTLADRAELLAVTAGQSYVQEPYICLYEPSAPALPFAEIFGKREAVVQRAIVRAWVGYTGEGFWKDASEQVVYITPEGSVCHRSRDCTYLRLSVQSLSAAALETARNHSGGKYTPCEYCVKNAGAASLVYITDYGNSYHNSSGCQGLKRTVMAVPWSEAKGRPFCSRCGGS